MALGWNKIWYFLCSPLRFLQPNLFCGKAVWSSMWAAFQGKQQGPSPIQWWKLELSLHFKAVGRCTGPELLSLGSSWNSHFQNLLPQSEFQVLAGGPFPHCPWMRLEETSKYAPSLCGPLRPRPSHIVPWWAGQTAVAGEPFIAEPWGLQAEGRTQYSTFFLARSTKISRRQDSRYSVPWTTPSEHCLPGSPVSIKWLPSPDHWVGSHSHKLSYTGAAPSLLCCP